MLVYDLALLSLSPSCSLIHVPNALRSHRVSRPISSVQPSKRDRDCDSGAGRSARVRGASMPPRVFCVHRTRNAIRRNAVGCTSPCVRTERKRERARARASAKSELNERDMYYRLRENEIFSSQYDVIIVSSIMSKRKRDLSLSVETRADFHWQDPSFLRCFN